MTAKESAENRVEEPAKNALASVIADFLEREDRTASWLAEQSGVHRATISRILNHGAIPDPAVCRALAKPLKMPAGKILALAGHINEDEVVSPPLDDPELGFYLNQIGKMPAETINQLKEMLRREYQKLADDQKDERPFFARH